MAHFEFYEVVRVRETDKTIRRGVAGREGAIVGISEEDGSGSPVHYSVYIEDEDEDKDEAAYLGEEDLESCGRFVPPESIYDGTSIRVPAQDYRPLPTRLISRLKRLLR